MNKDKINNFKKQSKRCISIVILLFLLDTGSKIGKDFLKTFHDIEEFVEEYDESLNKIIANYPLVDSDQLEIASKRIADNYFITSSEELSDPLKRIVDNYPITQKSDKNDYINSYLEQAIQNVDGNLNYGASLKKVINSYFNQPTDFALNYYDKLKDFIFDNMPIDGIIYQELNSETKNKCLATLSYLASILQEREEKKVL